MINVANIARPRKITQGKRERKHTYNYSFKKGGLSVPVCQRFFLNTLGFKSHQVLKTEIIHLLYLNNIDEGSPQQSINLMIKPWQISIPI